MVIKALSHVSHRVVSVAPELIGRFGHDVVQERVDGARLVAQSQRDVCNVHTEVAHHPDVTAGLDPTLPVDGFEPIDIGRVQEA